MRLAHAVLAAALVLGVPGVCLAQSPAESSGQTDPQSWTDMPGGRHHTASGTLCPNRVDGFEPLAFAGADAAALLGTCSYIDADGAGDAGLRVRKYVPGVGESRDAVSNDRMLMEPDPVQGPPMFAVRMSPVTTSNGTRGGILVITKARNGFLVDCFAEGATLDVATEKIARFCKD
jgi:hypothetical protein